MWNQLIGWFTGFGELSFQWIQICISSPMPGSSLICLQEILRED